MPARGGPTAGGDARSAGGSVRSSKSFGTHKPAGVAPPAPVGAATVGAVTSAPAGGQPLPRLLLLAVPALGVATLHPIGHAAIPGPAHFPALQAATAVIVGAPISGDRDGCDGDGCTH